MPRQRHRLIWARLGSLEEREETEQNIEEGRAEESRHEGDGVYNPENIPRDRQELTPGQRRGREQEERFYATWEDINLAPRPVRNVRVRSEGEREGCEVEEANPTPPEPPPEPPTEPIPVEFENLEGYEFNRDNSGNWEVTYGSSRTYSDQPDLEGTAVEPTISCMSCYVHLEENEIVRKMNSHILCKDCARQIFTKCCCCKEDTFRNDTRGYKGKRYCYRCFDQKFFNCPCCRKTYTLDTDHFLYSLNGHKACIPCFNRLFRKCLECDDYFHPGDLFGSPMERYSSEKKYCYKCWVELNPIKEYNYKPDKYKHKGKSVLYAGWELEIENMLEIMTNEKFADILSKKYDWLYCKHDGSLNYGFEIVTHPMSFMWYKAHKHEINDLLRWLVVKGFRSYNAYTCGFHVHLSRGAFSTLHLFKFLEFFYNRLNYPFLKLISQRTRKSTQGECQWGRNSESDQRVYNKEKAKCKIWNHKYTAVNLGNPDTIEIRIFRGTLKPASFHKNMEFVLSLYNFTSKVGLKDVTVGNYIDYVFEREKNYKALVAFLKARKKSLSRMVSAKRP